MGEISDGEWSELYKVYTEGSQEEEQPSVDHEAVAATTSSKREDKDSIDHVMQDLARRVEIRKSGMTNSDTGHQSGVQQGWHQSGKTSGAVQLGWQTSCGPSSSSSGPATQKDQEFPWGTDHQNNLATLVGINSSSDEEDESDVFVGLRPPTAAQIAERRAQIAAGGTAHSVGPLSAVPPVVIDLDGGGPIAGPAGVPMLSGSPAANQQTGAQSSTVYGDGCIP